MLSLVRASRKGRAYEQVSGAVRIVSQAVKKARGREQAEQCAGFCKKAPGKGINLSQFVPVLWLPAFTIGNQKAPKTLSFYPQKPPNIALSRWQHGFESPTGCQFLPEAQPRKQALSPDRPGAVFLGFSRERSGGRSHPCESGPSAAALPRAAADCRLTVL